jgi:hypothetical protein
MDKSFEYCLIQYSTCHYLTSAQHIIMSSFAAEYPHIVASIREEYGAISAGAGGGDPEEMISNIVTKFESVYSNPPAATFETVLNETFPDNETLRSLLFAPAECDVWLFVSGLGNDCVLETPEENKLRSLLLALIYLVHRYDSILVYILLRFIFCMLPGSSDGL